jgi:hypothetical protein
MEEIFAHGYRSDRLFAQTIPLLSNWGETLIFRRLKQRNFVEFSQSDKRGLFRIFFTLVLR